MRMGEVAHRTGTTPKAIRLYEACGLLGTVVRARSYRQHGEADVARECQRLQALDRQLAAREAELHACDARAAPAMPLDCDVQGRRSS